MSDFNSDLNVEQPATFREADLHEDIKQAVAERFGGSTAKQDC